MAIVLTALVLALIGCLGVIAKQSNDIHEVKSLAADLLRQLGEANTRLRRSQLYDSLQNATASVSTAQPVTITLAPEKRKPKSIRGKRK
jgi:hypothetical protein